MLSGVAACSWREPSARMLTTIPAKSNRGNPEHITFSPLVYIAIGRERQEFREFRTGHHPLEYLRCFVKASLLELVRAQFQAQLFNLLGAGCADKFGGYWTAVA